MCGIAGVVGPGATPERARAMARAMAHRGPDHEGVWAEDGVALGHRRLSILDLSSAGEEPMASADGRYLLTYNGEVYNYRELRAELEGYPFRSETDTEVVLAAFARWGPACLERFVGMFAFAVWDRRERRLFCARDRLGIKPFHWARRGEDLLFASEIKALLAAGVPSEPDLDTWATYLVHGVYDHSAATFFRDVAALPPGHTLTVEPGGELRIERYWAPEDAGTDLLDLPDAELDARFLELLDDAVRLRLRADVPLGVNLSGGLDSASLVATVDRVSDDAGALQTFTAAFSDPRYDEIEFADEVPRRRAWNRHVRRLSPEEVWPLAVSATWHQEAPFGGIATLGYHHLHGLAAEEGVTVLLEGQGVDEMLAGYRYFRPHHHLDLLDDGACGALRADLRAEARVEEEPWRGGVDRMRRLRDGGGGPVYQDGTSFLAPGALAPELAARAGAYPTFPEPYPDRLRNALYRDLRHTKLPRVLRMNDRLSMAWSRELREPYLDHRLVELLLRLPADQRYRHGRSKALLRRAMADRLPDAVRHPPKRAVVTPQREWLRGPLADAVDRLLDGPRFRERGLFDADACRAAFADFRAGKGSNAFFVWQWVGTELWFRRFVDGDDAVPGELVGSSSAARSAGPPSSTGSSSAAAPSSGDA